MPNRRKVVLHMERVSDAEAKNAAPAVLTADRSPVPNECAFFDQSNTELQLFEYVRDEYYSKSRAQTGFRH